MAYPAVGRTPAVGGRSVPIGGAAKPAVLIPAVGRTLAVGRTSGSTHICLNLFDLIATKRLRLCKPLPSTQTRSLPEAALLTSRWRQLKPTAKRQKIAEAAEDRRAVQPQSHAMHEN